MPSVTPNPTAPSPQPAYGAPDSYAPAATVGGYAGGGGGAFASTVARVPFGVWIRNLAIAGFVLGALVGVARAALLHWPPSTMGVIAVRLGVAGAAVGASIPPAARALSTAIKAAVWLVLALVLWLVAIAAAGQLGWLNRLR